VLVDEYWYEYPSLTAGVTSTFGKAAAKLKFPSMSFFLRQRAGSVLFAESSAGVALPARHFAQIRACPELYSE
jgi:hypothetical protein